jgi:hypothetical protein
VTSLKGAICIYEWAAGAASARYRPDRTVVADPMGQRFDHKLAALWRHLGESSTAPVWQAVLGSARALRWRAAVEPVPLHEPASGAAHALADLLYSAGAMRHAISDESARLLNALVSSASEMGAQHGNPLPQAVESALEVSDPAGTCLVLVNRRTAHITAQWLGERWPGFACVTPREYLGGRLWDEAILVGAAAWFPEQVFTAPRAGHAELVVPSWVRDHAHVAGLFGGLADRPLVVSFRDRYEGTVEARDSRPEDQLVPAERLLLAPQWSPEQEPDADVPEAVEVRRILLGGGYAVYLETDADRIRGLDPALPLGERVMRLPAAAIAPGSILLLRLGDTEGIALKGVADEILGPESTRIRALQDFWKEQLRQAVLRDGRESVVQSLRSHGSRTANVGYWISPDSIRPRSDHDFRAVLELIGVDDPEPYLAAGRALWAAHLRAGQRLTEELEQRVAEADLAPLDIEGMLDLSLDLPGVASITAFRVLAISPYTMRVHPHQLRVPFPAPEARWLE